MNTNIFNPVNTNGESPSEDNSEQIRKYLNLIIRNKFVIILLVLVSLAVAFIYSMNLEDIYEAKVSLKVDKPQGNILSGIGFSGEGSDDTYLLNQIALMKSYYVRDLAAKDILDTINESTGLKRVKQIVSISEKDTLRLTAGELRSRLLGLVELVSPKGIEVIDISVQGPSYKENHLIATVYANAFLKYNLELSRAELTAKRKLLEDEKINKLDELNISESNLEEFQKKSGIVEVGSEVNKLINLTSSLEALSNSTLIEIKAEEAALNSLNYEMSQIDPSFRLYVDRLINEQSLNEILKSIAGIEIDKELEMSNITDESVRMKINEEAENKINALRRSYDEQIAILKAGLEANTPEDRRSLLNKIVDIQVNLSSLRTKLNSVQGLRNFYEKEFTQLPSAVIEYAKLERNRKSAENLFSVVENKYQEALINERSRLGNVFIIDPGEESALPIGPNRVLITIAGLIIGMILGYTYAFSKEYFDRSIKSPDEIEKKGISVLSWIPKIDEVEDLKLPGSEFVIARNPKSAVSEAFKALRTRIQFSKLEDKPLKKILVSSSLPSEGKTTVTVNLAGSFALTNKKVLIVDCDLRKPKIHSVFKAERYPGLSDYLFSNYKLEEIIRETELENLSYITSGTIPPNPSELLGSLQMKKFFDLISEKFDLIMIDSPPLISVTDSEILFSITDGTVLVAQANKTDRDALFKTYQRLYNINPHNILGVVLNNFKYQSSYGYYYNYYYYYSKPEEKKTKV
jgi:capsular exopolysaccharide synthesis family protein